MKQIQVTAKALKDLVEQGKTLEEIREHFKDEAGNSLPEATAKRYLKQCDLKIKKVRTPKFVLVNDLVSETQPTNVVVEREVEANV